MVDFLTEIPLPGRVIASLDGVASGSTAVTLPAFVAGEENRLTAATLGRLMAYAGASVAALDAGGSNLPAVLNLFGPSGTGKTHLSGGLVRHWQSCREEESATYITAQDFRRQFMAVMNRAGLLEFRRRFRTLQLLALDDLHHLPGDDYLMQELRYSLDAMEENGGVIVVTSSRPVTTLASLPADVRSRFASGLMLQLAAPGVVARARIVQHVSSALGRPLSDEAINRLAAELNGNVNQLFGALYELWATVPPRATSDMDRSEQLLSARATRQADLREIIAVVSKYCGVPQKTFKSSSRRQSDVLARAIAIYLARELTGASYKQIGSSLGGRDHTTIMHSYKRIERDRHRDLALLEAIDDLRRILLCR